VRDVPPRVDVMWWLLPPHPLLKCPLLPLYRCLRRPWYRILPTRTSAARRAVCRFCLYPPLLSDSGVRLAVCLFWSGGLLSAPLQRRYCRDDFLRGGGRAGTQSKCPPVRANPAVDRWATPAAFCLQSGAKVSESHLFDRSISLTAVNICNCFSFFCRPAI
jgi:hypothetical protein